MSDQAQDTTAKPTTTVASARGWDFRPIKQEAMRMLSESNPIRQLLLAEPDVMPAEEFVEKITRYICLSLDYRRNTRDRNTWISTVFGAAAPVEAVGETKRA